MREIFLMLFGSQSVCAELCAFGHILVSMAVCGDISCLQ